MSLEILDGLLMKRIKEIGKTTFGLCIGMKKCWHQSLLETLPTYLYLKGCRVLRKVKVWNQSHKLSQKHVRVYDILNAGPKRRFTVWGDRQMVVSNCQSTGHDLLVYWVDIYSEMLDAEGIEWYPIIADFHDESIIEVKAEHADRALEIVERESFDELNRRMGNIIPLQGDGLICDNLADIKIEE